MAESEESELIQDHKDCKQNMKKVQIYLHSIAARVERFFSFADLDKTHVNMIKKAFNEGNYKPLNDYTSQLNQFLKQSQTAYERFTTAYEQAERVCRSTVEKCRRKKSEIKSAKKTVLAVGAGASIGILAIGVMSANLSPVSIKYPVVSSIASALLPSGGAVATGVIVTSVLTRKIQLMQWAIEGVCEDLELICAKVSEAGTSVEHVKEILATIADDTANAELSAKDEVDSSQFATVFDILLDGIKGARKEVSLQSSVNVEN